MKNLYLILVKFKWIKKITNEKNQRKAIQFGCQEE